MTDEMFLSGSDLGEGRVNVTARLSHYDVPRLGSNMSYMGRQYQVIGLRIREPDESDFESYWRAGYWVVELDLKAV